MLPWLTERFGNPSGAHAVARAARAAIDEARDVVGAGLGFEPGGVIFTSGGTEADNLAVLGPLAAGPGVVVTGAAEHHAVLHAAAAAGVVHRTVPSGADGVIDLDALEAALDGDVRVVSVVLVNNEIGTVAPLAEIAARVRRRAPGAVLHTDAVQAVPWLDVATAAAPADLVSVSAHKFGGPQGVGALLARDHVRLGARVHGGGQERERRSGTHNVAGIVGMAAALEATADRRAVEVPAVGVLRDRLADGLLEAVDGARETGDRTRKVAGNCHLRIPGLESEALLLLLDEEGVCASAGSACASGAMEPSHVLTAMGIPADEALSSVRFSLGHTSTSADVDLALKVVPAAVAALRGV
jgi:cysteine desulfurase